MDVDLYDEFGNYIGPELPSEEESDDNEEDSDEDAEQDEVNRFTRCIFCSDLIRVFFFAIESKVI